MNKRISNAIRDTGPYSSRYTSKGALLVEANLIINSLSSGLTMDQLRKRVLEGYIIRQRTRASRERVWDSLNYRLFTHHKGWIIESLKEANANGPHSPEFVSMVYLFYALRDRLTYDIVTDLIWSRWQDNQLELHREDILSLLDEASTAQPQVRRWSESSRVKLASSILAALRDFGILEGVRKKRIVRPILPLFTAEQLLHVLTSEGVYGREVIEDSAWRLFLCSEQDVADILARLSQLGKIHFERVGNTVILETPESWKEE